MAGVSLNAIIGDNGIITNAMSAKQKSGMAALEEFIEEYYVSNFEDMNGSNNKVEQIKAKNNDWFYKISEGYIVDNEGHALYLFVKDNLPEEIKEQLVGGDAGEGTYRDYYNLNDVYGVTSNLKVYYCKNGIESLSGIEKSELDMDILNREIIDNKSNLGRLIVGENSNEKITLSKIRNVGKLTINEKSGITDLQEFYKLTSLKELTLENLKGNVNFTLNGLRNAVSLNYLYFKNCDLSEYEEMKYLTDLKYLYLEQSCDDEVTKLFTNMIGKDYTKLEYLGIYGRLPVEVNDYRYFHGTDEGSCSEVEDLEILDNLSNNTKKNIKYLYLNNNNIVEVDCLSDFTGVQVLELSNNNISSIEKCCENMNFLRAIAARNNKIVSLKGLVSSVIAYCGFSKNSLNDISDLSSNIKGIDLSFNKNLVEVAKLADCGKLMYIYLKGCHNMKHSDVRSFAKIYNGVRNLFKSIDDVFLDDLITEDLKNFANKNYSDEQISTLLENNEYVTKLSLADNTALRKYYFF